MNNVCLTETNNKLHVYHLFIYFYLVERFFFKTSRTNSLLPVIFLYTMINSLRFWEIRLRSSHEIGKHSSIEFYLQTSFLFKLTFFSFSHLHTQLVSQSLSFYLNDLYTYEGKSRTAGVRLYYSPNPLSNTVFL